MGRVIIDGTRGCVYPAVHGERRVPGIRGSLSSVAGGGLKLASEEQADGFRIKSRA